MARKPTKQEKVDLRRDPLPSDMPINTKSEARTADDAILQQCTDRMNEAWEYWQTTYENSKEDVRFCYEDQWPQYAKKGRENRPMLTMNQLPGFVQQVVNAARRSRFAIQVKQLAGKNEVVMDNTGTKNYSRSQIMEGLVRDIEVRSKAHDTYCDSCKHQVEGGFGWWVIKTKQCMDDPFDIELCIEHVKDRYGAMIDPNARMKDFSDAKWCTVSVEIPQKEFEERWPDKMPSESGAGTNIGKRRSNEGSYNHESGDTIKVTDYWWKEPMKRKACEYIIEQGTQTERLVMYEDDLGDVFDELTDMGYVKTQEKEIEGYRVKYARCTETDILDGPHIWPSMHLPLVMVRGREVNLEGNDQLIGLLRYAHDPQRMVNFWMSAGTEKMALVPRQPYIASQAQIGNHLDQWQNMYTTNSPVLLYDSEEGTPPPARQSTIAMAQGELQMIAQSKVLLMDAVGLHDANLGRKSNEVSGVALEARAEQGEQGTFDFIDNLAKAIQRTGEILVDMIPRIYTTDYVRRVILEDDSEIHVDLNKVITDEETGRQVRVFSLDFARYACRVDVGPASKTQREEFAKMMMEWGRSDPEGFPVFRDLIIEALDFPMARVVAKRMKAMVPRELLSPEDQEELPQPEPTPADEIESMKAQAEQMKAQAEMMKAQAMMAQAQIRSASDQTRLQFEQVKGQNRAQEQELQIVQEQLKTQKAMAEQGEQGGLTEEEVVAIVKRETARQLAAKAK